MTETKPPKEWQKRPTFIQWVEDAKQRLKSMGRKGTLAEVADIMGLALTSIKKYIAKDWNGVRPGDDALRALGDFLERDYRQLYDDPAFAPPGISANAWAASSFKTRVLASAMFEDLLKVPEDEQDRYVELFKKGIAIGLTRIEKEREEKDGRKRSN